MSVYRNDLIRVGILKVGDLINENNVFLHEIADVQLSPEQRFFIMGIVHSLPAEWKRILQTSTSPKSTNPLPCIPLLKLKSSSIPISDATAKKIYETFSRRKQVPPTAKQKLSAEYPDTILNWEKVYSLPFRVTMESKIREFQYKVLNNIVFTNEKLFRFGLAQSPSCTFCQEESESLEHLLFLVNFHVNSGSMSFPGLKTKIFK